MNTDLFSPAQIEQYNKDVFLAERLRALGLSNSVANKLENLVPTQVIEGKFSFNIVPSGDADILRGYALNLIKAYAEDTKAAFVEEITPPPPPPTFVPIDPSPTGDDLPRAVSAGWIYVDFGTYWAFYKNTMIKSIPKSESLLNFNNNLQLI